MSNSSAIKALSRVCVFLSPFPLSMSDMAIYRQPSISFGQGVQHILRAMDRRASDWERHRAKEIAEAVLDGRTTILEGARELSPLAHTDAIANEDDRKLIIGIDSETDHLPVGKVREHWAADALEAKDVEITIAEERWKARFRNVCKRIAEPSSLDRGQ